MSVSTIISNMLCNSMHQSRIKSIIPLVESLIRTKQMKLTPVGRGLSQLVASQERSCIRRVDRCLANCYYQTHFIDIYAAITRWLLASHVNPLIVVDWSSLPNIHQRREEGEHCILRASLVSQGRGLTLYEEIHAKAYEDVFGYPPPNKEERKRGKVCNFAGVYGAGYTKFLITANLEDNETSKAAFKKVSTLYEGVNQWKKELIRGLKHDGYVRNLFGRTRKFSNVSMDDEREAINWTIQSSGHDILKIYLMEVVDRFRDEELFKTLLISEVHDSQTYDTTKEEIDDAYKIISELAMNLNPLINQCFGVTMRIPIIAEVEKSTHWS